MRQIYEYLILIYNAYCYALKPTWQPQLQFGAEAGNIKSTDLMLYRQCQSDKTLLVSTYVVCERLSVMHKQVSGWTVNFCPNSPESPFLEFQTRKPPPHFGKLQIWDDQPPKYPSPISENFRFEMTKVYSEIPPPFWNTSDLRWPKFTPKYPPFSENFRFEMTKVYSEIPPPHFGILQIWDDQSLLQNTPPPFRKTSDLRWPKFTPKYPPPHFGILQIWDDQSLLRNTPPFRKTSDLRWPKFTPKYPPHSLAIREIVCGD